MPLLRINIVILSTAFSLQSILQGGQSALYVFSYILKKDINIDVCSAIRLFGNTVHGIVDFIPFSLAVIRYNIIFRKEKKMTLFWISQVILVIIRLTNGIYPTISSTSKYVSNSACGYVKSNSDNFMKGLQIFSISSEIIFPIIAFIINIIILDKASRNLKRPEKESGKKEQKQLFWSLTIQILMPFFCHLPSIHLAILRMTGFHETVLHVIIVDTLNTIAYSLCVLSIIRYNKVVRQTNKHFWIFWIFQLFFIIIRLLAGIYPTISKDYVLENDFSCVYVRNIHDTFMNVLRMLSLTFEIIFPIIGFIVNIIILYKTLPMFKSSVRKDERKEQKQLFWFMTIQILMPFLLHIPSIHVFILRISGFRISLTYLFTCETLNTFAYSTSVFISTLFVPKLKHIFFGICYTSPHSNNRTVKRVPY
ncbi:Hypothetical protein SRAE_2000494500 [Strongyloides ratti]|uniref:G-protein coupled receptors family 1 profile domain-containing protein n=1 Tax=Strongyloides ratti TaxID=34506 RepID=A0A090LKH6_STRRB|nr:Hypothetical protein SRAE_2000494500 [Strongyloides ratti]CEF70312.1 Hypothetical protein SRAE_2000494500 [Strongyloides ratti]